MAGSSPRVRGKQLGVEDGRERRGLIPARAGKTTPRPASRRSPTAHPRACGENSSMVQRFPSHLGSSPRVRGKPVGRHRGEIGVRLIPARAGKTPSMRLPSYEPPAHPRACGENVWTAFHTPTAAGSSPRVRGKHNERHRQQPAPRLIPACAGKTAYLTLSVLTVPAHPRVCGEN